METYGNSWRFTVQRLRLPRCYRDGRLPRKRKRADTGVADYCTTQTAVADYRVGVTVQMPRFIIMYQADCGSSRLPRKRTREDDVVYGFYTKQTVAADYRESATVQLPRYRNRAVFYRQQK